MCLFSILCSAQTTKQQEQQQQQSAATMPSKPAVTGKCQCFNNPTPLMSAAVECLLSLCMQLRARVCQRRPGGAMPSVQQARTMHTQEVGMERKQWHTPHVSQHPHPADTLVPFHETPHTWTPDHLSNNSSYSFSSLWNSLETELQHLKLC